VRSIKEPCIRLDRVEIPRWEDPEEAIWGIVRPTDNSCTAAAGYSAAKWSVSHYVVFRLKNPPMRCGLSSEFFDRLLLLGRMTAIANDSGLLLQTE